MASVTFEEAVRRAVKAYYEGSSFEAYEKARGKPSKYKLDTFKEMEDGYRRKYAKKGPTEADDELEIDEVDSDD